VILVAIGVVFSPFLCLKSIYQTYRDVFSTEAWGILTTPGTDIYHPMWAPLIIVELIGNLALGIAWVYAAFLLFKRRRSFPRSTVRCSC
jgi:hypothetical protein